MTLAVRDTTIDGLEIHENDILGMVDGKSLSTPIWIKPFLTLLDKMIDEDSEIVMIYVGEEGNQEHSSTLPEKKLEEAHEDIEVEIFRETNQFIHTL